MDKKTLIDFQDKLGLKDETIHLKIGPDKFQAELEFNKEKNMWTIYFDENTSEFSFIHELGHIYIAKKRFNNLDYAVQTPYNPKIDERLYPLLNNLGI